MSKSRSGTEGTKEHVQAIINSKDRIDPTDSTTDFTWSFNRNVTRVAEIMVRALEIPFTYYTINATNNYFLINGNVVTITPGTYTATSLIPELQTKISASPVGGVTTITFSTITYKYSITNSGAIQITSNSLGTSPAATLLGFKVTSASATTITGDSVINLSGPNYILVRSDYLTRAVAHKTLYINNNYINALTSIPVIDATPGSIIGMRYDFPTRLSYKIDIPADQVIDIALVDENNNVIDLNGADWAIQLVFLTE